MIKLAYDGQSSNIYLCDECQTSLQEELVRKSSDESFVRMSLLTVPLHLVIPVLALLHIGMCSYHERRLYEDLMRDYNSLERPVENHSLPVIVSLPLFSTT